MHVLTRAEAERRIGALGWTPRASLGEGGEARCVVRGARGDRALGWSARTLARWLTEVWPSEVVVLVCGTGVWPSGENMPMFHEWRRGVCGDPRALEECPGHVLDSAEVSTLASLLQFAMMNRWDALAVTQWRGVGVDHEGALSIGAESEAECRRVLAGQS